MLIDIQFDFTNLNFNVDFVLLIIPLLLSYLTYFYMLIVCLLFGIN